MKEYALKSFIDKYEYIQEAISSIPSNDNGLLKSIIKDCAWWFERIMKIIGITTDPPEGIDDSDSQGTDDFAGIDDSESRRQQAVDWLALLCDNPEFTQRLFTEVTRQREQWESQRAR